MKMRKIVVPVPNDTKAKLNEMRRRGYSICGIVRQALAEALRDVKVPRRAA
jgi:hypothetical protein